MLYNKLRRTRYSFHRSPHGARSNESRGFFRFKKPKDSSTVSRANFCNSRSQYTHHQSTFPVEDPLVCKQLKALEENASHTEFPYWGLGHEKNGIVHVVGPEYGITQPGATIVCGDSHTSTHGAFGAIAFGIGTSEVEMVLSTQCIMQPNQRACASILTGNWEKALRQRMSLCTSFHVCPLLVLPAILLNMQAMYLPTYVHGRTYDGL